MAESRRRLVLCGLLLRAVLKTLAERERTGERQRERESRRGRARGADGWKNCHFEENPNPHGTTGLCNIDLNGWKKKKRGGEPSGL